MQKPSHKSNVMHTPILCTYARYQRANIVWLAFGARLTPVFCALSGSAAARAEPWAGGRVCGILPLEATAGGRSPPHPAAMPHATRSRTMTERCTLDGFVITPMEPQGSLYPGTDQ